MESERFYTSVRMDAYRQTAKMAVVDNGFLGTLKNNYGSKDKELPEDEKPEEEKENNLDFLKGKFNEMSTIKAGRSFRTQNEMMQRFRHMCINYILALLMGKKPEDMEKQFSLETEGADTPQQNNEMYAVNVISSKQQHYYCEEETTSYQATGKVLTEDGREINFNLELNMSRRFEEYYEKQIDSVSIHQLLLDPLVINFDGGIDSVSDQKFYFDLDSDGTEERISSLSKGSGFLALDANEDGVINDGSELFGTKSGDGFKDLSEYDSDNNGWIDENDDVFNKLKIYVQNEDGTQSLYTLKDKNVGAIYLGSTDTDFSMNNLSTNEVNAKIRQTGIFLYENGGVGTVQHVDLAMEVGA